MNRTMTLDGVWAFLSSISLSAQGKQWLGERLIAEARREVQAKGKHIPVITKKDLQIDPEVAKMFKGVHLPFDFDERSAYREYLAEKYQ